MKKVLSASNAWSNDQLKQDLDSELAELISYAKQFAGRTSELTSMGLASVLEDVEKMTSTLRRDVRTYLPDKPQPQVSVESQLKELASDMLYQLYDNEGGKYAEISYEYALNYVIDHIKWIVFEADDDNQYTDVAVAFQTKPQYCEDLIRDQVGEEIYSYSWTVSR